MFGYQILYPVIWTPRADEVAEYLHDGFMECCATEESTQLRSAHRNYL